MILITYFGLLLGVAFFLLFLFQRKPGKGHLLLASYLLFLSIAIAEPIYQGWSRVHIDRIVPELVGGLYFLVGPILLLYARTLVGLPIGRPLLHGGVFIIYTTAVIIERVSSFIPFGDVLDFVFYEFFFLHVFVYLRLAFRTLFREKYNQKLKDDAIINMNLSWGRALIMLSAILFGLTFAVVHVSLFVELPFSGVLHPIQVVLLLIIILIGLLNTETSRVTKFIR